MGQSQSQSSSTTQETAKPEQVTQQEPWLFEGVLEKLIPRNNSQYDWGKNVGLEGEASYCTYCAYVAESLLHENEQAIVELLKKKDSANPLFATLWNSILNDGATAFMSNGKEMLDPNELDKGKKLEETLVLSLDWNTISKFATEMTLHRYTVFNLNGETVLVYHLGGQEDTFLLVDTHLPGGFFRILNLEKWLETRVFLPEGTDTVSLPTANFSKQK